MRVKCAIETSHRERRLNAENALYSPQEMQERFADHPEWLRWAQAIADAIEPAFELGQRRYPRLQMTAEESDGTLRHLTKALSAATEPCRPRCRSALRTS